MTKERELLSRALDALNDREAQLEKLGWGCLAARALEEDIRTYLAVEEQYDALRERYAEGLGESMKACKESFEREAERAKELITAPSDDADEPVAWMFQHEDTGLIDFVDTQQVEWGFEKNNPRWQKIGPVYLHPPKPAELELEEYDAGLLGYFGGGDVEWWQDYIRDLLGRAHDHYQSQVSAYPPKPAESEAEYDFYGVIPLTHRKAKGIIKDRGYHVTGFVLSRPDGDKCIVDMSAVRWLSGKEFFEMMHPPVVSPTAEPEAETIETLKAENFKLASGQCTEGGPWGDKGGTPYCKYAKRKPMTAKEMLKGIDADTYPYEEVLAFVTGIRFAEKHHGIGGDDE
jgi:hypothetical protein